MTTFETAYGDALLEMIDANPARIAGVIDHTLLRPDATEADIARVCDEALQYQFASVCVNPTHVRFVAQRLRDSSVKTCSVVGFPLGATTTADKVQETGQAIASGAQEIDMVINIGALKGQDYALVEQDITAVAQAAHSQHALCKVIIETTFLTDAEKVMVCELAARAGADFVKTSTGFSGGGATVEDVALMRKTVGPGLGVKASGGVRDYAGARAVIAAGANRIGASSGVQIVKEALGESTAVDENVSGY